MYDKALMENKLYELAFPDGIYQYVHTMCYIHPIHIILGFYYEMYLCGLLGFTLFCTSFNYWSNPIIPSIRRNVDMFAAFTIVPYHYYLSLYSMNKLACVGMGTTGVLLYPVSLCLQHNYNYVKAAAFCHCLMHMFIGISACFLYRDYYEQGLSLKWNILSQSHHLNTDNTT